MPQTILRYNLRKDPTFFRKTKKLYSSYFLAYYKKDIETNISLTVLVSKKTAPLATTRNFLKRKTKEVFKMGAKKPGIFVLLPKKEVVTASMPELVADIKRLLHGV